MGSFFSKKKEKTTKKQTMIHYLLLFKLIASNAIASVVSIVLQTQYFHDICIFSKKMYNKAVNFTRSCMCVHSKKSKFGDLHMLKIKISRILKLATWQHCIIPQYNQP